MSTLGQKHNLSSGFCFGKHMLFHYENKSWRLIKSEYYNSAHTLALSNIPASTLVQRITKKPFT